MTDQIERRNRPALSLHVPEPEGRPGDEPDFSHIVIPAAGEAPRPDVAVAAAETHPLCFSMIRVLDDDHKAVGPWDPRLDAETVRRILRDMMMIRASTTGCIAPSARARLAST